MHCTWCRDERVQSCWSPGLGQGTLGRALVSQAVLDEGISEELIPGGRDGMTYGDIPVAPLIFQDDLIHTAEGLK